MKSLVYLLGIGVLGVLGYNLFLKKDDETIIENPITNSYLQTQPSNKYPIQAIETPRVDNADQPWYSFGRDFLGEVGSDTMASINEGDSGVSYNTNAFWSELESKYMH